MAVVENRFVCDLSKPVQSQALKGNVFSLDNLGSRLSVLIYNNGQPATISGSVTANCILPDGSTVNVNGGLTTENGGSKAYVDVPQSCLLIPGILKIAIKCTSSSVITTLAAIVANVYMTKTDNVITPSQQIITDWNAEISASLANQDAEISDLKSALYGRENGQIDFLELKSGYINSSTGKIAGGGPYYKYTRFIPVSEGDKVTVYAYASNSVFCLAMYADENSDADLQESKAGVSLLISYNVTIPSGITYIRACCSSNYISGFNVFVNDITYQAVTEMKGDVESLLDSASDRKRDVAVLYDGHFRSTGRDVELYPWTETGAIDYSTGIETPHSTAKRTGFIKNPNHYLYNNGNGANLAVFLYDENYGFISYNIYQSVIPKLDCSFIRIMDGAGSVSQLKLWYNNGPLEVQPYHEGTNLLDVNHPYIEIGQFFNNANGVRQGNASYSISWFIPVEEGETYYLTGCGTASVYAIIYDKNLDIVSGTNVKTITIPQNGKYLRVCFNDKEAMVSKENGIAYTPFMSQTDEELLEQIQESKEKIVFSSMPDYSIVTLSTTVVSSMRVSGCITKHKGKLEKIHVKSNGNATATIYLISDSLTVIYRFDTTLVEGNNELINGKDFTYDDDVYAGTRIGIQSTSGIKYGNDGCVSLGTNNTVKVEVDTNLSGVMFYNYNISIGMEVSVNKETYENELFNKVPRYDPNQKYYFDTFCIYSIFSGTAGNLKLYTNPDSSVSSGSMLKVDIDNWSVSFMKAFGKLSNATVADTTVAITIPYFSNHQYQIWYSMTLAGFSVKIKDTETDAEFTTSTTSRNVGSGNGYIGYLADNTVIVSMFKEYPTMPYDVQSLILGDSYIEGSTMWGQKQNRWASEYAEAVDGKVFINGEGGHGTSIYLWMNYLHLVCNPRFVIISLGVNANTLMYYKQGMTDAVDYVKNMLKAVPVLVTIPPTVGSGSSSIYSDINAWVKASGVQYLDMAKALTVNGDGTTQNLDLFFADKIHPNAEGHEAIYKQLQIDLPELFNDY